MTLSMPDSTVVAYLPPGSPAYLGYVDGRQPTISDLARRFPHAWLVGLTVTGATLGASGIDCEPGNVNAADTRVWVAKKLAADPFFRPVIYASVIGEPNFGMGDVLAALGRNGIGRDRVRLLSAHYGRGQHICGPGTCGAISIDMDGTQWVAGIEPGYDLSVLRDDFFGNETEAWVQQLGTVKQGDTGEPTRTVQGCLNARHTPAAVDGIFGPQTAEGVKWLQARAGIPVDGIVGPQTWPVLLGIA